MIYAPTATKSALYIEKQGLRVTQNYEKIMRVPWNLGNSL
jgi:hypothetical protein